MRAKMVVDMLRKKKFQNIVAFDFNMVPNEHNWTKIKELKIPSEYKK